MNSSLENRVVWITGAGKGIGAALAWRLAAMGVRLFLTGRTSHALEAVAAELHTTYPSSAVVTAECDVASWPSVERAHAFVAEKIGAVDVLVNNAGVGVFVPLLEMRHEDFERTLNTNLRGAWHCIKAVLPAMVARTSGVIVNINSIAAMTTFTGGTAYAASKAGLLALSRSLRQEVRAAGVKVIDVLPGATETDIWEASARREFRARMMQPDDVAEAVVAALLLHPRVMPEELTLRPQLGDL